MKRFGIIADLHLPADAGTEKERVFDWALNEARSRQLECIFGAGDLTSNGMLEAAGRVRAKLETCGIPFALTPGNADLRERQERQQTAELMSTQNPYPEVFLLDTSRRKISENDMLKLQTLSPGTVVITHCPPETLPFPAQYLLRKLIENGRIGLYIAGHVHTDQREGVVQLVRGLDPDKASGGPPALAVFEYENGIWKREDLACPLADPRNWTLTEKEEFFRWLGVSGMSIPLPILKMAAQRGIGVFEYRFDEDNDYGRKELCDTVKAWRDAGGRVLLASLPVCSWRNGKLPGLGRMQRAVSLALEIGCDQVHIKMPQLLLAELAQEKIRDAFCEQYCPLLAPLKDAGCRIAFENAQMTGKNRNLSERNHGCLPDEAIDWCQFMRDRMNYPHIGLQLNLGNARNNTPYPNRFTLSQWYAATGRECIGYTLHQVIRERQDKPLRENFPLDTFFGKQISLSSFTMAWQDGTLPHAPMILEIKDGQGIACWDALKKELF